MPCSYPACWGGRWTCRSMARPWNGNCYAWPRVGDWHTPRPPGHPGNSGAVAYTPVHTSVPQEKERLVKAYARERFSTEITLTPAMVAAYAAAAGDTNP